MAKKIRLERNENDAFWFHVISLGVDLFIPYWDWSVKVDLERMEYLRMSDEGYNDSPLPTLGELGDDIKMGFPYKEFDVVVRNNYNHVLDEKGVKDVIRRFKENGWHVTREAVEHQLGGYKCGYRDEANGYHLFTPCGGNELAFRLTTLHDSCRDWQITYTC